MSDQSKGVDHCRVLSIQSHVVHGYVGNRSAMFPLQMLGFEVDAINSVQFSNHTGYSCVKGQVVTAKDLTDLFDGLKANNIHKYTHILTGYVGDKSFLEKVVDIIKELKKENPEIVYVCDPVMGDNGSMYVPKELLPVYKDMLLPLADVVCPNQFEAELLSGVKITSEAEAERAMQAIHALGAKTVVLSSTELSAHENLLLGLGCFANNGARQRIRFEIPKLPATFVGTGDLFAALLLAWTYLHPGSLQLAMQKVLSTMQDLLKKTLAHAQELAGPGKEPTPAQLELRLIQSKKEIAEPSMKMRVDTMCDLM